MRIITVLMIMLLCTGCAVEGWSLPAEYHVVCEDRPRSR